MKKTGLLGQIKDTIVGQNNDENHLPGFLEVITEQDRGKYGEGALYFKLKYFERMGARFLNNVYLPKDDNETTEIDLLMICECGIFVFESKNYSGWIFGDEASRNWCQTLENGQKNQFYNPVFQNNLHLRCLKQIVGKNLPMYSVVVFSNECSLKKITLSSSNVKVVKRKDVFSTVLAIVKEEGTKISIDSINDIYNLLFPYTQVSKQVKEQHIQNIRENINKADERHIRISSFPSTEGNKSPDLHGMNSLMSDFYKTYK